VEIDLEIMPRLLSRSHKTQKREFGRKDHLFHVNAGFHPAAVELFHVKQAINKKNK